MAQHVTKTKGGEPYIGSREAARILGWSLATVWVKARERKIPSYCPNGEGRKPRLYLASELRALIEESRVDTNAEREQ